MSTPPTSHVSIERRNCHTCAYFYVPNQQVLLGIGKAARGQRHVQGTADKAQPGCFLGLQSQEVQAWIGRNMRSGTDDWPRRHPCPESASDCPGWSINAAASNAIIGAAVALHDAISAFYPRGGVPHRIDAANKGLRNILWPKTETTEEGG